MWSSPLYLVFCYEGFDLLHLLWQQLLVLVVEAALGPLQPAQQTLQQLLGGQQLAEGRGQTLLVLPGPSLDLVVQREGSINTQISTGKSILYDQVVELFHFA